MHMDIKIKNKLDKYLVKNFKKFLLSITAKYIIKKVNEILVYNYYATFSLTIEAFDCCNPIEGDAKPLALHPDPRGG